MPFIDDRDLNQFIADPTANSTAAERQNPSLLLVPAPPTSGDRPFCLKLKPPVIGPDHRLTMLSTAIGWVGIAIYYLYHPLRFSLVGVGFYLGYDFLACSLMLLVLSVCETYFYTGDRTLSVNPLAADLASRGRFWRALSHRLRQQLPPIQGLFPEKYRYDDIRISSDINQLRHHQQSATHTDQQILRELARRPEMRRRWKYRDPRLQEFLAAFQAPHPKRSIREIYLFLSALFLLIIPSEDGLFLAPPALLGLNGGTTILFALLFGFAHWQKYSTLNCLRIVGVTILQIIFILPQYGLLTCMVGHVLFDLLLLRATVVALVREAHSGSDIEPS
jgi:hypothetical protein